ncbi:MAG: hypothetical protein ACOYLE_03535 [Bacteroidales bacterium]
MKKLFIISIICFFISSCQERINKVYCKKTIDKELNIRINDNFEIINSNTESAIGDYIESFTLKFQEKEYKQLFDQIDTSVLENYNGDSISEYHKNVGNSETINITFHHKTYIIAYVYADL